MKTVNFNGKTIAKLGIFTGLSFVLTFLEIPIFPAASFLKLDFSNVFVLICGFALGAPYGLIVLVLKELLTLTKYFNYVGMLANIIMGVFMIIIPLYAYQKKRTLKTAIVSLVIAIILHTIVSLPVNYFINFPFYTGSAPFFVSETSKNMFLGLWGYILAFNLIKGVLVSLVTLLLYKRLKNILHIFIG
ncbi:MAG: ECF transporter S component [Clostridia bacterium]|nr:ECF transporter S component [Clostridia bacterium]